MNSSIPIGRLTPSGRSAQELPSARSGLKSEKRLPPTSTPSARPELPEPIAKPAAIKEREERPPLEETIDP